MKEKSLSLIILVFLSIFFGCSKSDVDFQDVTSNYKLPPELKGAKIFVLGGGWSATKPVWVVVAPKNSDFEAITEDDTAEIVP